MKDKNVLEHIYKRNAAADRRLTEAHKMRIRNKRLKAVMGKVLFTIHIILVIVISLLLLMPMFLHVYRQHFL